MKVLIDRLDLAMKRIFYVKDEHGEFVKVRIIPIPNEENARDYKFQINTGSFVAVLEKDKKGKFHCYPEGPQRLMHNISIVINRYYKDIIGIKKK